jgi:hypothetical protein
MRAIIRSPTRDFVEARSPCTFHVSAIPFTLEVIVLLLDSEELAAEAIDLGGKRHELRPLERMMCARFIAHPQCRRVKTVHDLADGVGGGGARAAERWAGCAASNSRAHGLNDLGDIRVVIVVVGVVILELAVIVEIARTGLGVDEILDLMCPLDLRRTFTLAGGLLLLGILCK